MIDPHLHDVIETLYPRQSEDPAQATPVAGALGTIVQIYDDGACEVEFTDGMGQTVISQVLTRDQFIIVWCAKTGEAVSLSEQVAQIVTLLPEGSGTEVLDFARFLSLRSVKATEDLTR